MTNLTDLAIRERLRQFIRETFLYMRPKQALGDEESLMRTGIVDSMGVMEVLAFLQDTWSVTVADQDLTEENLGTISAIARYVMRSVSGASPDREARDRNA
ncbi:MAG: phosphopantetheine-binding protein [Gemmatimonadota bacterium]